MSKSIFQLLTKLEDKIEELDDLILCLYDKKLRESISSIVIHFSEVSNEISDLILQLDEVLSIEFFDEEDTAVFNSKLVRIIGKCKVYDTDYSDAKDKNKVNADIEESHKQFIKDIKRLNKRIEEYNSKNKNKLYDFRQAVKVYNNKSNEIFFEDLRS